MAAQKDKEGATPQYEAEAKAKDERPAEPPKAGDKPQAQGSKAQELFEKPYNQYLQTLQDIQKEWHEETRKQLSDLSRAQLETSLAQANRGWNQGTWLPSPCVETAQMITASAWEAIKGKGRTEEAYAAFLTQLKNAFAEVKQGDLDAVLLDGIANCMKVVACCAYHGQGQQAGGS